MNILLDLSLNVWSLIQAGEYLINRNQWFFYTFHTTAVHMYYINIKRKSMASVFNNKRPVFFVPFFFFSFLLLFLCARLTESGSYCAGQTFACTEVSIFSSDNE